MSDKKLLGTHTISSLQELELLATLVTEQFRIGDIVCLQGDLGAGKTTFVQFVAQALGILDPVTSPTYTIMAEYDISDISRGIKKLIHIDAYRESMDTNYVHEILRTAEDQKAVVLIEWPEKLGSEILQPHWNISITSIDNSGRIVVVSRVE
ncbi:MAG: tRNA (adenosine(37)-N6)-threonylcarbamoyltransferase complex ATPase subunit type 1 TsaE [Candidatus Andersenbacteria bacterium]|nr:tRNA (adenosine(37)-N6)-threonylcarbamoyltransferase complex ATPase subunit type 1 TsaE [Candidatus Andersenbacteria bacterium]